MSHSETMIGVSAVAIDGRALLIEGPPGSGKSSLALALIDRGALLIGDDGVTWQGVDGKIILSPPPNIAGRIEIRGVGIVELGVTSAPLALVLAIDPDAARYPEPVGTRDNFGVAVPCLPFRAGDAIQAMRAEWALRTHGLTI